ncbi:MAG: hypothetical protein WCB92_07940 [Mycobacterium sp.]
MAMDMVAMGLLGTVVGASAMGASGVMKSMADSYFPGVMAGRDHKHQVNLTLQSQRHEALRHWRAGLCTARDQYRQWAAGPRDGDPPNVVGDEWFEGLRPHLPTTGVGATYRAAHEVHCDNQTVMLLSLEIGRIENEWVEDAKGRDRRRRNRRE